MTESITITLDKNTLQKLDMLKTDENMSYEEVVTRLADEACLDDAFTPEDISRIEAAKTDIREGRGYTAREVLQIIDAMDE